MANTFSLTGFTSKTLGTLLTQKSPFMQLSYRGIQEFVDHPGYGVSDTINVKIYGYPTVQTGLSVTATDITDLTVPYTISNDDIYNVSYEADFRELEMKIVDGKMALSGNPNVNPDNSKEMNPQAKTLIDKYVYPAGVRMKSKLENVISEKSRLSAFYTPVDTPAKLKPINQYADVSSVGGLMDNLGFMSNRYGVMNVDDGVQVTNSLQNMFNPVINDKITKEARLGGTDKGRLAGFDIWCSKDIQNTEEAPQYAVSPTFTVNSISGDGKTITFGGVNAVTSVLITAGSKISIPSVNFIDQSSGIARNTKLVVCAASDASGDGSGNVAVELSVPLLATGINANVDSLPANGAAAELYPEHTNNYFFVPMGYCANSVALAPIYSADMSNYKDAQNNIMMQSYVQGLVPNGVNTFRLSTLVATLAIPYYIVWLPGQVSN